MYLKTHRGILDHAGFTRIGRGVLAAPANEAITKVRLSDLLKSIYPDNKMIAQFLLRSFWNSAVPDLYRQLSGDEPLLLLQICTMRLQHAEVDANYVPWHLDANFYGFGVPFLTVWAPFVPVGRDAAGLEFCTAAGDGPDDAEISAFWGERGFDELGRRVLRDDELDLFFGGRPWQVTSDDLVPGDAFIFDQHVLHRTQILETARSSRLAIEFRVASRSAFPHDIDFDEVRGFCVAWMTPGNVIRMGRLDEMLAPAAGVR